MKRLEESTSGVKMAIAEQLIPVLLPLINKVKDIISSFSAWAKEHPNLTKVIVIGTAAFGFLLVALGSLLLLMPGITAATAAFGITLSAAIWPVTLIVAAIVALIAIGVLLWKNWDTIKEKTIQIWGSIKDFFVGVWKKITAIFRDNWQTILAILFPAVGIPLLIAKHWDAIVDYFNSLWQTIATIFAGIAESMWVPIKSAIQWIINYIETLIATLRRLFGLFGGGAPGTPPEPPRAVIRREGGGEGAIGIEAPWVPTGGPVSGEGLQTFQRGGIAMRPILASVATKEPEAVIPLSKLGDILGGRSVNIFVELDGRTLAKAVGQPLVDEIRLKAGMRI